MANAWIEYFKARRDAMMEVLRTLVEHESPSRDKNALDALADRLEERFSDAGGVVERIANEAGGDHLIVRVGTSMTERPALVVGHFDTVWPRGTLAKMPFAVEGDRASGPGIFDMKASLVMAEFALRAFQENKARLKRPVTLLWTSDEEVGSPTSRELIEERARESAYALVLESPLAGGRLKTARKGVGGFVVEVEGRAAHAGIEPEKGINAIVELAHQMVNISALGNPSEGTTVNVGVVEGGTTPNTVPALARARIDVRVSTPGEAKRVERALWGLKAVNPEATVRVEGRFNRPPMVRTDQIAALFERAREIGASLGLELTEGSTGGASDGNVSAAVGTPTLDGLGPLGGGAHAPSEHIIVSSLPERATLLTALLAEL